MPSDLRVMLKSWSLTAVFCAFSLNLLSSDVWPQDKIPFVPSPMSIVDRMLEIAEVKGNDVVYDLGSGDGRVIILAAKKYGAKGVGIDIDPKLVELARSKAEEEGVSHLVEFRAMDALEADLSEATVVTLYMFHWFNNEMRPKLQSLKYGSRIVAHDFEIQDWPPTSVEHIPEKPNDPENTQPRTIFLWRIDKNSAQP
jgi:cyclopropane fatty-acyl-phospholipid synthase-like methyltransferase